MSFKNFIPRVTNAEINRELERLHVFADFCVKDYEGDVKKAGDSVRILGIAKPTVTTQTGGTIVFDEPEVVEDTSITMQLNQIAKFNYRIDDLDKRMSEGNLAAALNRESSEALVDEYDRYIANLALTREAKKLDASAVLVTKDNILTLIDKHLQALYENDVKTTAKIALECSPRFYMLLKQAYTALDTNNSEMLENGRVGKYGSIIVKMTNNVAKGASGTEDKIFLRTDRAIAFAKPFVDTEAYRPEKYMCDAVKGAILYDAKIVRPKELVVINAKYA